jgi:hypothetical protein
MDVIAAHRRQRRRRRTLKFNSRSAEGTDGATAPATGDSLSVTLLVVSC